MKLVFKKFEIFTTCCDVIVIMVPNFRKMAQNMEQRNYQSDRHQNWYLEYLEGEKFKNEVSFCKFSKFTTCCDVVIPNFREMAQNMEQRKY